MKQILGIALLVGLWSHAPIAKAENSCFESSNPEVCFKMRHMRSHLFLIEQKLLSETIDYPYFSANGTSMEQLVMSLIRSMSNNDHIDALEHLRLSLLQMKRQAEYESVETFVYANQLGNSCGSCHESVPVDDGENRLFTLTWHESLNSCRVSGKNPFVCQKMHALAKNLQFFRTADGLGYVDYSAAAEISSEINDLAIELAELVAPVHPGGNRRLMELGAQADVVKSLALEKDPQALDEGVKLLNSCKGCHSGIDQ